MSAITSAEEIIALITRRLEQAKIKEHEADQAYRAAKTQMQQESARVSAQASTAERLFLVSPA